MIRLKRAYDEAKRGDGHRVLVDALWPRGVTKEALRLDVWLKEIAPSTELRKWFGHDPQRFAEFRKRYLAELSRPAVQPLLDELARLAKDGTLTLVFGAHDPEHNNAVVLAEAITRRRNQAGAPARRSGGRQRPATPSIARTRRENSRDQASSSAPPRKRRRDKPTSSRRMSIEDKMPTSRSARSTTRTRWTCSSTIR